MSKVEVDKKLMEAIRAEFKDIQEELEPLKETVNYILTCVDAGIERLDMILEALKK